jgi:hypothetical protein
MGLIGNSILQHTSHLIFWWNVVHGAACGKGRLEPLIKNGLSDECGQGIWLVATLSEESRTRITGNGI